MTKINNSLLQHTDELQELLAELIDKSVIIHKHIETGEVESSLYGDYFEYLNYQLAQVISVINSANQRSYKEAFIISRSLFEHMLLFTLMTSCFRYYKFFKKKKSETIGQAIERINKEIADAGNQGKVVNALRAVQYQKNEIAVIFKGLFCGDEGAETDFKIPWHYFLYKKYTPEFAFLDRADYFKHMPDEFIPKDYFNEIKNLKKEHKSMHDYYMRPDSMLESIKLNNIYSKQEVLRAQAHYNFLSMFVHPTKESVNMLKAHYLVRSRIDNLNELRDEKPLLRLLSTLYVIRVTDSMVTDLFFALFKAPKKYIRSVKGNEIKELISHLRTRTSYFWFIKDMPHDYDKFTHCLYHEDPAALGGDYRKADCRNIKFDTGILRRLERVFISGHNQTWGCYRSPLE